jgi:hypothetical protein
MIGRTERNGKERGNERDTDIPWTLRKQLPTPIPNRVLIMKASTVTVGALALSLSIASMGSLSDSTRQDRSESESLFADEAADNAHNNDQRSVIDHGSSYETVDESVLYDFEPSGATVLGTRRKRTSNDEPTTIVVRQTTEPLHSTERDTST